MESNLMSTLFVDAIRKSEYNRLTFFKELQYLWNKDYEEIKAIVKKYFENVPFSSDTLNKYFYLYRDEIRKVCNRKTAGIYDIEPIRELVLGEKEVKSETEAGEVTAKMVQETDPALADVLRECKYQRKVKDIYRMSKFFNTVIAHPIWRNNKLQIDILTGAICSVTTKDDYLEINEIKIARVDSKGNVYNTYWSEEEHRAEYNSGERKEIPKNDKGVNPFINDAKRFNISPLPFSIYRDEEGMDFWGEPNWALFTHQIEVIMTLSDNVRGEFLQKFPPLVNTDGERLPNNQKVDPGIIINLATKKTSERQATLNYLTPGTDWANIRENADHRRQSLLNSEGIPESSASTTGEGPKQVGAKYIDELELQENRDADKDKLYDFEIDLLNKIRMVNNYYQTKPEMKLSEKTKSYFQVSFIDEEAVETAQDKKIRREMEKQYNIKTDIDFIMEDREVDEAEAKEIYQENKSINRINGQSSTRSILEGIVNNNGGE